MKAICTIGFLFVVLSQALTQNRIDIEAINFYVSNNTPKENERLVNEIYLQKEALGHQSFSPMQIQVLYSIAHQCPEIGGTAVYRARSIYALIGFDTYENDCDSTYQTKMKNIINVDTCYSEVPFLNPSLEGPLGINKVPTPWIICSYSPDTYPYQLAGNFIAPSNGISYVHVVAVASASAKESFGQLLGDTLFAGVKYRFAFDFASYGSSPVGNISIWISDSICEQEQLIYIANTTDTFWRTNIVEFIPNFNCTHFKISGEGHSGNLIDNLRFLPNPASCDTTLSNNTDNIDINIPNNPTFKVYPNPNNQGLLTVEWTATIPTERIVLIDALGRVVGNFEVTNGLNAQELDIKNLPSGSYIVLLKDGEQILGRKKLIVMR